MPGEHSPKAIEAGAIKKRRTLRESVAVEPLIYQSDRRGCRLEFTPQAAARAASEWPGETGADVKGPLDLIDFYRRQGARFLADVGPAPGDDRRMALHQAIRKRYKVLVDQNFAIVAELTDPGDLAHGQ